MEYSATSPSENPFIALAKRYKDDPVLFAREALQIEPDDWQCVFLRHVADPTKRRISVRSAGLYAEGLVDETRGLVERYGADCPLLDTIGYGEAKAVLRGELQEAEAIAGTTKRTQQFAKRQRTWFRRQHQPRWLESADPLQEALSAIGHVLG